MNQLPDPLHLRIRLAHEITHGAVTFRHDGKTPRTTLAMFEDELRRIVAEEVEKTRAVLRQCLAALESERDLAGDECGCNPPYICVACRTRLAIAAAQAEPGSP